MNVTGPSPATSMQRQGEPALELRLNQRLAAEVLKVSGDRVILALEGVQVVARLTSTEQAAALSQRHFAQFIVRDLSGPMIALQLVQPDQPASAGSSHPATPLIPHLLQNAGLPVEDAAVILARALLNQGLPLTAELVRELHSALSQANPSKAGQPGWGQAEANIAATLKALGLPLTAGSLSLVSSQLPSLLELLGGLRALLQPLLNGHPSAQTAELAQKAMAALDSLMVRWSGDPAVLAEELRRAVSLLGLPLEHELAQEELLPPDLSGVRQTLMALANLRRELAKEGSSALLDQIDRFLDGVRRMQFLNAGPESPPAKGQWLRLDLPLAIPMNHKGAGEDCPDLRNARLRIAYRPGSDSPEIDPTRTRFVIRIDLGEDEALQVDLSLVERRIGAQVTASSEKLRLLAEGELPSLQAGLERLGYTLQTVRCETESFASANSWELLPESPTNTELREVRIEI